MEAVAVLLFHDCLDLFLQLVADHSRATGFGNITTLPDFFKPINDAIGPDRQLQHEPAMRRLNAARNGVKHHSLGSSRRRIEQVRAGAGFPPKREHWRARRNGSRSKE